MSSIAECQAKIRQYNALKAKIGTVISGLSSSSSNIEGVVTSITGNYQIDGDYSPIYNRSKKLKNDIDSTSRKLSGSVIPAINSEISKLYQEIERLREEERRRRERERMQAGW